MVTTMRGFGLLIAMDAIDLALREQGEAARKRPTPSPAPVGPDGLPSDGLDDANATARMSAWRAWAHRREVSPGSPAMRLASRASEADGAATSS